MSYFNLQEPNGYETRFHKILSDEYWVKQGDTFVPLVPGGGGGDIPYYLKPNSIDIDDPGNLGTELTGTALTFGDSTGNVSINRAKAKVLDDLNTMLESATPDAGAFNVFTAYDPTTKKLIRNPPNVRLWNSATANGFFTPTSFSYTGANGFSSVAAHLIGIRNNPSSTGISIINTNTIQKITFIDPSGNRDFMIDDIAVTNKIKALAAGTPGVNSKMLIYDTTTKAFNHATIPSGSASVPSYVQPTKLVIPRPNPAEGQSNQIEMTNVHEGVTSKLILSDRTLYMMRDGGANPSKGADIGIDQFVDLAGYKVPKNYYAQLAGTQFQHASITGATGTTEAKVTFTTGGAEQAPFYNLPEGGKLFLQVTGLNRSTGLRCYGIRLPFFAGQGNLSQYRFTLNGNADIDIAPNTNNVQIQNENVAIYRCLENPAGDLNIKAGTFFINIYDNRAIGDFTGTIIIERLSAIYENYTVLVPT
jgi:hypothetical protein